MSIITRSGMKTGWIIRRRGLAANPQMIYLFFSNLIILFTGMGLFPLLPLYASQLGANHTMVGNFFTIIYIANAAGPLLTSLLVRRVTRKNLFIASGVLGIPALLLLGQATTFWQVVVLTSVLWFSGGMSLTLIGIFTGLNANAGSRGKSFSLMALTAPLGALTGGAAIGQLVAWNGYGSMFVVLGLVWAILPAIGFLGLTDQPAIKPAAPAQPGKSERRSAGSVYLLLLLTLLFTMAVSIGRFGTSISMQAFDFSPSAVASSATISGLVAIPATFLIGTLSDRLGRKRFLVISYLLASGGALILSTATQLWQFWLAASLLMLALSAKGALTSAMVTDMLAPEKLNRGLSWLNATNSLAGILSFSSAGYAMEHLGMKPVFLIVAALPILAAILLEISSRVHQAATPARSRQQSESTPDHSQNYKSDCRSGPAPYPSQCMSLH